MVHDVDRTPLSPSGDAGSAAFPGPASEAEPAGAASDGPTGDALAPQPDRNVGWDPLAIVALILVVLTLAVPAAILGGWAVTRARGDAIRTRRAWIVTGVAVAEMILGGLLWTVYFVWLAPIITLPAG